MSSITLSINFDRAMSGLSDRLERGRLTAQKALDTAFMSDTDPFVPMRQGTLASSVIRATKVGSGRIEYATPYARHLYYGVHYKTGTPFSYSTAKHPLACKEWAKASKAVNMAKWKREVKEALLDELN